MRVIIDTNILVSGLISHSGAPSKIVEALLEGEIIPVMSAVTFRELEVVLLKPRLQIYFERSGVSIQAFLQDLKHVAEFVLPVPTSVSIRDEKDHPFIELAMTIPEPEYLITGDKDFEERPYGGCVVISASVFVQHIRHYRK